MAALALEHVLDLFQVCSPSPKSMDALLRRHFIPHLLRRKHFSLLRRGRGDNAVRIDNLLRSSVFVYPADHIRHHDLQCKKQDENQQEADDGVLESLLRFFTILLLLCLGKLDAENHAEDGSGCTDDAQQGTQQRID